jgi:hypothetical protein
MFFCILCTTTHFTYLRFCPGHFAFAALKLAYGLNDRETGVQFSTRVQNFSSSHFSAEIFALSSFLSDVGRGCFALVNVVCVEVDHSPVSNVDVTSVCKCTSDTHRTSQVLNWEGQHDLDLDHDF